MPATSTTLSVGLGVFLHRQTSESCCERRRNGAIYIAHRLFWHIKFCKNSPKGKKLWTFVQNMLGSLSLSYPSAPPSPQATQRLATKRDLFRVVRSAERTTRTTLIHLQDIYTKLCRNRARRFTGDLRHPINRLFCLLPIQKMVPSAGG